MDRVVEVEGPENELLEALYSSAMVLLYPSRFEGFGWPIIEAQACGCPVICGNREPMSEVGGEAALTAEVDDEAGHGARRILRADRSRGTRALEREKSAQRRALPGRRNDRDNTLSSTAASGSRPRMQPCAGSRLIFVSPSAARPLDLQLIAHRGPDASGEWTFERWPLLVRQHAASRFSIFRPTGAQPMIDPATGNVLVVNGEIYNHLALRAEMLGDVAWRGTSDTETLLHGLRALGSRDARQAQGHVRLRHLRSRAAGTFRGAGSARDQAALLHSAMPAAFVSPPRSSS